MNLGFDCIAREPALYLFESLHDSKDVSLKHGFRCQETMGSMGFFLL